MRAKVSSWIVSVGGHVAAIALLLFGLPFLQQPIQAEEKFQGIEVLLMASAPPVEIAPQPVVEQKPPPPPDPVKEEPLITSTSQEPDLEPAPPPKPKPEVRRPPKPQPPKEQPKPVEAPPETAPAQVAAAPVVPLGPAISAPPAPVNPNVEANYLALIAAILEKKKDYPRRAQLRNLQGITVMGFTLDAQGRVLKYKIERSSGYSILDEATERMIEKVGQLPPIPAELNRTTFDIVMPMQYVMKK